MGVCLLRWVLAGTTGGFNFAEFSFLGSVYQFGDFSGKASLRSDWKHHVSFNNAIIFVVDSSAPQRLPEARQALAKVLREGQGLEDSFLLVVANKQVGCPVGSPSCMGTEMGIASPLCPFPPLAR